nr:hypothetical protein [Tanacetum cinerariifolium]
MAHPVQNINHSAFKSMFEREKLSENNFNDWFRQLKLVLRVEKKMFVIKQPLPMAPTADFAVNVLAEWNALYDAYSDCLMLGSMTPELHRQFENYSPYEMLQELKPMFEKQAGVERVSEMRNRTLLDMVRSMMNLTTLPLSFWDYALESATRILNMVPTKKVDNTPYELCEIPIEVEGFKPPQEEVILIRRSERTHRALNRLCLNVEVEEQILGDLNDPASYKAAMLDLESNKRIDSMNAEIQSTIDNMKNTDTDGIVRTYKALLVAKGYTQLYGVDYEEMFSPIADIRAIRILISIAAFYDYEIWKMDVKT